MTRPDDDDVQIARRGNRADRQVDKFFQRAPFLYSVLVALLGASAVGGAWTWGLQSRVKSLEETQFNVLHDPPYGSLFEQAHNNRRDIERNGKQIRSLNVKVFQVPDPGE